MVSARSSNWLSITARFDFFLPELWLRDLLEVEEHLLKSPALLDLRREAPFFDSFLVPSSNRVSLRTDRSDPPRLELFSPVFLRSDALFTFRKEDLFFDFVDRSSSNGVPEWTERSDLERFVFFLEPLESRLRELMLREELPEWILLCPLRSSTEPSFSFFDLRELMLREELPERVRLCPLRSLLGKKRLSPSVLTSSGRLWSTSIVLRTDLVEPSPLNFFASANASPTMLTSSDFFSFR
mmetsp:Transcript_29972/g.49761  ORF Transcript_29972/g.49761 Transcript_29972/m.49761 type:complete len:240 (-) Transcript_29972:1190-1909(-)